MAKRSEANLIDTHVGRRVRMRRLMLKMSQEKLGDALGVTYQQVQKYEKGMNHIGPRRLQHISSILKVPIAFFFEGSPLSGKVADQPAASSNQLLATSEGVALVTAFGKIKDKTMQRAIVRLVAIIARDAE